MYKKKNNNHLSCIPENMEYETEVPSIKWVPKKKHEVLKAKYKCLKKLFQVYDASLVGLLPEECTAADAGAVGVQHQHDSIRHHRHSPRTNVDATVGTSEPTTGDASTEITASEKSFSYCTKVTDAAEQHSSASTQVQSESNDSKVDRYAATQDSRENITNTFTNYGSTLCQSNIRPIATPLVSPHIQPHVYLKDKRQPTRFQSFIQRLLGIRRERALGPFVHQPGYIYSSSDNNIYHGREGRRRRRRGLRFRRRPKKIRSEGDLRDRHYPLILTYVQSAQRACLLDTAPRQCPITGCRNLFYGIINYNDHLNLSHCPDRRYICHYCHEGFEKENDKLAHENEHIGLNKLKIPDGPNSPQQKTNTNDKETEKDSNNTIISEDKLRKIVSFFDKIIESKPVVKDIHGNRYSESNLRNPKTLTSVAASSELERSECRTVSCMDTCHRWRGRGPNAPSPFDCHLCGERFPQRRQLSLHVDLEHRVHEKYSKFQKCIVNRPNNKIDLVSENGEIRVESSSGNSCSSIHSTSTLTVQKSEISALHREKQSKNKVESYTSVETLTKKSTISNIVHKVKAGICSYKWEPGTKIIHV